MAVSGNATDTESTMMPIRNLESRCHGLDDNDAGTFGVLGLLGLLHLKLESQVNHRDHLHTQVDGPLHIGRHSGHRRDRHDSDDFLDFKNSYPVFFRG
jgi:hypothetical protein